MRLRQLRRRRRAPRKSRALPKTGWTLPQIARLAGLTPRVTRHYFEQELLPRPRFQGRATRYDRVQLLWLVAIRKLRSERLGLGAVRQRLTALSAAELEAYVTRDLGAGELATALGFTPKPVAQEIGPKAYMPPILISPERRFTRIELAVGLELHVRDDVTPLVLDLAKRVWNLCAFGESGAPPKEAPPQAGTPRPDG